MKKKQENNDKIKEMMTKILTLRGSIEEEYDLIELVSDSISDIFDCDLDCSTCTEKERGVCMQNFKKANFYWIRKVAQDEWALKNFTDKISKLYELVERLTGIIVKTLKSTKTTNEFDKIVDERKQIEVNNEEESSMFS